MPGNGLRQGTFSWFMLESMGIAWLMWRSYTAQRNPFNEVLPFSSVKISVVEDIV
jgi:hypothetical protein